MAARLNLWSFVVVVLSSQVLSQNKSQRRYKPFGDEARLLNRLLRGYERATRPVANASHTIEVKVNFALTQILDLDEKNQVLTTNVWFTQEWNDEKLRWNPDDYNGLKKLRIPPDLIWRPDIVLYNGVDDFGDKMYSQCLAMVSHDGTVFWAPVANIRSTCKLDLTYFPFDEQSCYYKVGSWTYDGFQVDLINKSSSMDLEQYTVNGGWDLVGTITKRNVVYYPCCPEPFPDVRFTIFLRRRVLFYMLNVIVPCLLLSSLSLLGFWLPVGTSEKVTLGLTVLLAFYVLMLSLSNRIPETSEYVPLLGLYLVVITILTSISVSLCVFILHLHKLGTRCIPVPRWVNVLVTRYIARLVCVTYMIKHRKKYDYGDFEESKPLRAQATCEDNDSNGGSYKLVQLEGSGLYILAKDESFQQEKDAKDDTTDVSHVHENGKSVKSGKTILIENNVRYGVGKNELMWNDVADVLDRLFFWLCFLVVLSFTVAMLVIIPLTV